MTKIAFLTFCLYVLCSCKLTEPSQVTEMYFTETQCANPWKDETAESWLNSKKITYSDLRFESYKIDFVCQACTCPSGRNLIVKAHGEAISQLQKLGFQKK
jgi:hypothetical protein